MLTLTLSEEQANTMRHALEEACDWASETLRDIRRDCGEDSDEFREQTAYAEEIVALIALLPEEAKDGAGELLLDRVKGAFAGVEPGRGAV